MNKISTFSILVIILLSGCKLDPIAKKEEAKGHLIFQSGFEGDVRVINRNNDADIIGSDKLMALPNNWVTDLDNHPDIGNFNLQYQGGDSTQRFAKIISEPGKPNNKVLQFWLKEPNVEGSKGRIQANLYGNKGLKEFYQSVRVFLPNDLKAAQTFPKPIHWLTIAEFWNNVTWSQTIPYGFRITLGIGKPSESTSDLYFILDAQDCQLFPDGKQKYTTVWAETNQTIKVPIDQWFTMEYYYKEGNQATGRFYLAITPDNESKKVIFDEKNFTHHTQDPNPNGVTDFNPLKLYTSKELISHMRTQGKTLQIFWDDFKLYKDKRPD